MKETLSNPAALDRAPNIFDALPQTSFISSNGDEWIEQRRFCLHSARDLGLGKGNWETIITDEVRSFTNELRTFKGAPVDASPILSTSVSSNIILLITGRKIDKSTEAEKIRLLQEYADVALTVLGPSQAASVIPGLGKCLEVFRIAGYDKAAKIIRQFSTFLRDEIARHKTSPEFREVQDFINSYLQKLSELRATKKVRHYFTEDNLEGLLNAMFLGGSDTVISSTGWLIRLMAKHQDVQDKVFHELMDVLGKDGAARFEERQKIPYTFAVLMESQRYSSIVPLSTTRCANQDFVINGYTIPKGAEIVGNMWALHHDPKYWDEPEKFLPERFLANGGKTLIKSPPSFTPFSIGRRNCPGENIAWMEILSYFSEIVKRFRISTPQGVEPQFEFVQGLVTHLKPQPLCFTERTEE